MSESIPENDNDKKKGFELLYRFLRLFPFSMDSEEDQLNAVRKDFIGSIWDRYWLRIKAVLDELGFTLIFSPKDSFIPVHTIQDYYHNIHILTQTVIKLLFKEETMECTYFFQEIYNSLIYYGHHEEWKEFSFKFGFRTNNIGPSRLSNAILDTVMALPEFREQLNKIILEYLGHGISFKTLGRGILSISID